MRNTRMLAIGSCGALLGSLFTMNQPAQADEATTRKADEAGTRKALETNYSTMEDGLRNKDVKAFSGLETADFTLKAPDGRTLDHDQANAYWETQFAAVKTMHTVILKLDSVTTDAKGTVATAIETVTAAVDGLDGNMHEVVSTMKIRDTWVNVDQAWKFKHQESVWQVITVDGKRLDGGQ